jgi:hypothetical protein
MDVFRKFWVDVVGVDQPKLRTHQTQRPRLRLRRRGGADGLDELQRELDKIDEQADAAEDQADDAARKAQVMQRMADLVDPFKEAVAARGPDAQQLQALFGIIKSSIAKKDYTQASEALDLLEQMLDVPADEDEIAEESQQHQHGMGVEIPGHRRRPDHATGLELDEAPPDDGLSDEDEHAIEQAAEAAAYKAQIMHRLAGLVGPFQQAVRGNAANVEELQKLFEGIRDSLDAQKFTQAADDLDELERLLKDAAVPEPSGVRPRDSGMEQVSPGGQAAGPETAAPQGQTRLGIGPGDVFPVIKDVLGPLSATCKVTNNTEHTLILDPASLGEKPQSGEFKSPPPPEIPKGKEEWIAVSKSLGGLHFAGVEFKVRYFIDEQKTAWTMHFDNPRVGDNSADAKLGGPNKDKFKSTAAAGQGSDAVFLFTLNPVGGTGPGPGPGPGTTPAANASCLITINNNSKVALTLTNQTNERGDFMTQPPVAVQPGASASFVYVQTPNETDPKLQGCKGSLTWNAASTPPAVWRCEWDNPFGDKNSAKATVDPAAAGLQALAQTGQGEENVPVIFTLSGDGGGVPPITPPVGPPVGPPVEPPPVEPEFKKPPESKQPTLRKGDKSADGWVEYLQARLNRRLNPSPNLKENGDFDNATHKAVIAYQQQEKLLVDGIVGNQTWAALRLADPEKPSTDGLPPHTFVEKGLEVRWLSEGGLAIYFTSKDEMELACVAVGDDTKVEGQPVNIFVTPPGGKRKGVVAKIGPVLKKTDTGQGNLHQILLTSFKKTFPSTPPGAKIEEYVIEGFFDQSLGGDFWTSTRDEIVVKP